MSSDTAHAAADPRQRLQNAKRALYRSSILNAAEPVFAEGGYEAARVQTIAKAAGVSLATLYSVFPKKEDVFAALQRMRLAQLLERVDGHTRAAADPFDRLVLGLDAHLRFHMEHVDYLRLELQERIPWGTTDELRTPEQTRAWQGGLQMMTAAFGLLIHEGLLVEEDPELCARTSTAMHQARLALWVARGGEEPPNQVARAAVEQWVRCFARPERVEELLERVDRLLAQD